MLSVIQNEMKQKNNMLLHTSGLICCRKSETFLYKQIDVTEKNKMEVDKM